MPKTLKPEKIKGKMRRNRKEEVITPVVARRGPGRPRKLVVDTSEKKKAVRVVHVEPVKSKSVERREKLQKAKEVPVDKRRKTRVHNAELLKTDAESNRVPLQASRVIEQLTSMLDRADIQKFSGRRERPSLILSKLESQTLEECKVLFELKVSMQQEGQLRRKRVG